jgi:predicted Fe-S protein YdhL (DUF1289 family)
MPVASPCQGVCKLHLIHKICQGCYRSPLELRVWDSASDATKQAILDKCAIKREIYGDIRETP